MKKLILSAAIVIAAFSVNAQNKFGLQAGANFASVKSEFGNVSDKSDSKVGFIVGALADVDFGNSVSFRPELNFIQKGGKSNTTQTSGGFTTTDKSDLKFSYIQLSPNFVYNFTAGTGKVFVGVGPEFSYGIGGNSKDESTITGPGINTTTKDNTDVKFDGKKNGTDNKLHLKGFDFGANAIAGYTLNNGAFISAGYTVGLQNISPEANSSIKNSGFNVKVGFLFGGTKAKK